MKILPIVLTTMLAMGTFAIAQDNTPPSRPDRPSVSENQRGQRGPQFRGGMRGPSEEMLKCPKCQAHRKHMQKKHPNLIGPGGQRGLWGPGPGHRPPPGERPFRGGF